MLLAAAAAGPAGLPTAPATADASPVPLRELAAARGLRIGAALADPVALADPGYADTLAREFDMGVSENDMKWGLIHPGPTTYATASADAELAFAEANQMVYRGHNLAWHNQNPPWLLAGPFTRDERIAQLRDHIHAVVGRYRGRIAQWDVVNEALDGVLDPAHDPWSTSIGFPDYLDIAFRAAHEADPDARLYYNDYLDDIPGPRTDRILELVAGLRARGVPIDGVGLQTHTVSRPCDSSCANEQLATMLRYHRLGLEVAITELDVAIPLPATPTDLAEQASVYRTTLQACLLAPNCHTVVLWGFTDAHSWIPSLRPGYGAALPFDENLDPKPAYDALHATLDAPPTAPTCASYASPADAQAALARGDLGAPLLDPDGDGRACAPIDGPGPSVVPTSVPGSTPPASTPVASTPVAATPVSATPALTG